MPLPTFNIEHAPAICDTDRRIALEVWASMESWNVGEENAVTSKMIEEEFFISSPRLRAIIHYLREIGVPICSSGRGYYYANTRGELAACVSHLRARRDSLTTVINSMEAILL